MLRVKLNGSIFPSSVSRIFNNEIGDKNVVVLQIYVCLKTAAKSQIRMPKIGQVLNFVLTVTSNITA
jgi:hypothetical protein